MPDYPIYLTEFGFFANEPDELAQARYSSRAAILLAARPTIKLANFFLLGGDGGAGLAIWDTSSESILNVPIRSVKRIQDMMGRNVVSSDGRLIISQSPLYLELRDDSLLSCLSSATTAPGVKLTPGQSADIGYFDDVIVPEAFSLRGKTITAALNIEPGQYRLIGKANGKWRMVTITISTPTNRTDR